jgi:mannan endo-1,4-beta-mannosidase
MQTNFLESRIYLLIIICSAAFSINLHAQVNFTVAVKDSLAQISPYIFGTNQDLTGDENWGSRRQGGNRMTGYNWENNASNAGSDYLHSSDNYLTYIGGITNENEPGIVASSFHDKSIQFGAYSLITLQMAGYVSRDKDGVVPASQAAPSVRWEAVQFAKGKPFSIAPDTSDGYVYMDEYVNFLVNKYGRANSAAGVKGYSLDNEPSLWPTTHPRIHPQSATCQEIVKKAIDLSVAVKAIDPYAEIFGPALYGYSAYINFQGAPDWTSVSSRKAYKWFIDYYLDQMKKANDTTGKRLLDALDIHWYSAAIGDNTITSADASTYNDKLARVQAPRTLWDSYYTENSWIGKYPQGHLPLLPNLFTSINKYYPGTKLAFTEFSYGGETDISGGIAAADALGIFAKYGVYFATAWPLYTTSPYLSAAYRIYRNYDGNKSTFGNYYAPSQTSDSVNTSIYGSIKNEANEIHLVVINKDLSKNISANFSISSPKGLLNGRVWAIDSVNSIPHEITPINNITNNSFAYTLPAASVCHFVITTSSVVNVKQTPNSVPAGYYLGAYPNPFNPSCKIEYRVPNNLKARMDIFSPLGALVKSFEGLSNSGLVVWDGTNNNGQKAASGVYSIVLRSNTQIFKTAKIALIK